jgi:hypothetical protein
MLSLATADCGWMVLTTAMPSGARDSRANHHRNPRAGDEREGKCSKKDELLHNGLFLSEAQLASSQSRVAPSGNGECDVQHNISLPQLFVASAKKQSETEHNGALLSTRATQYRRLFNFSLRQPGSSLTPTPNSFFRMLGGAGSEAGYPQRVPLASQRAACGWGPVALVSLLSRYPLAPAHSRLVPTIADE